MMQAFNQKECDKIDTLRKEDCSLYMLHLTDKREATASVSPDILVPGLEHIGVTPDMTGIGTMAV